jgi:hypothetical protein
MAKFLQLALWNATSLSQHTEEHNINVMLNSQMHFTEKSYLKLANYTVYHTNHPVGSARGGTDIIIKKLHQASSSKQLQSRLPSSN